MKKSLFNKPAWAAKASAKVDDNRSIFQQNVYEDILEANRRKEEKRRARQKEKDEQRSKSASRDTKRDVDEQPVKKQRISTTPVDLDGDGGSEFWRSGSGSESDTSTHSAGSRRHKKDNTSPTNHSIASQKTLGNEKVPTNHSSKSADKTAANASIPLDDDDEIVIIATEPAPRSQATNQQLPEPDSDSEEDEYLRNLKRAARAEAREKDVQVSQQQGTSEAGSALQTDSPHGTDYTSNRDTSVPLASTVLDPEVQIRIKTIIPGCDEIYIKRRASQPLDMVLEAFIKQHDLRPQIAQKVFFTWNGTRLFRSTTMRSILAQIKNKYGTKKDGSDMADGKIEIEAVTDEIFELRQQQKERERKRLENEDYPLDHEQANPATPDPTTTSQQVDAQQSTTRGPGTVIQLRSNDERSLPSMHLRVRSDTKVEKIIRGYKKRMGVDPSINIYLIFDGDKLEDDQIVENIGFEDGDSVDIRSK